MSVTVQNVGTSSLPNNKTSENNQINLSHRTRKRIREAKKKARPGRFILTELIHVILRVATPLM